MRFVLRPKAPASSLPAHPAHGGFTEDVAEMHVMTRNRGAAVSRCAVSRYRGTRLRPGGWSPEGCAGWPGRARDNPSKLGRARRTPLPQRTHDAIPIRARTNAQRRPGRGRVGRAPLSIRKLGCAVKKKFYSRGRGANFPLFRGCLRGRPRPRLGGGGGRGLMRAMAARPCDAPRPYLKATGSPQPRVEPAFRRSTGAAGGRASTS